jgi:2-polyprenyl-3-methyl-5-hydroxy-6-metoxy-1,4-benzoquinol methylase
MKHNTWLHKHLNESANKCLGIDINEKSIDFIKQDLGYTNTICANILTDNISAITDQKWDILVLGEILEHIDDPVEFLKNIKAKYQNNIETIIITVPNAFYIDNFYNTVSDVEIINSDHRYWFTPYTLSKIMVSAGIKPTEIYLCQRFPYNTRSLRLKKLFKKWILKKHPYSRNTIIELGCF